MYDFWTEIRYEKSCLFYIKQQLIYISVLMRQTACVRSFVLEKESTYYWAGGKGKPAVGKSAVGVRFVTDF